MNLHDICEALYALPSGRVVARRRTITKALATMLLGVALWITNIFAVEDSAGALSMTLMVVGISLAAYGLIRCIVIASSKESVPYDTKRGEYSPRCVVADTHVDSHSVCHVKQISR